MGEQRTAVLVLETPSGVGLFTTSGEVVVHVGTSTERDATHLGADRSALELRREHRRYGGGNS